jgi:hypothetical protein
MNVRYRPGYDQAGRRSCHAIPGRHSLRCVARPSWTFVLWGMWHGLFLWFERLKVVNHLLLRCPRIFRTAYAGLIVLVGWVLFRADSLPNAMAFIGRMFGIPSSTSVSDGLICERSLDPPR